MPHPPTTTPPCLPRNELPVPQHKLFLLSLICNVAPGSKLFDMGSGTHTAWHQNHTRQPTAAAAAAAGGGGSGGSNGDGGEGAAAAAAAADMQEEVVEWVEQQQQGQQGQAGQAGGGGVSNPAGGCLRVTGITVGDPSVGEKG